MNSNATTQTSMLLKYSFVFLLHVAPVYFLSAQSTFYISGKYLFDPCGDTVLLRGINYAPYNWGYSSGSEETAEIEQTGANCVRLVWYANGSGAPYYTNDRLDSVLTHCAERKMIPILELHDQTCQNDSASLVALADWYMGGDVMTILLKHQTHLIVNIANEALYHNWTGNAALAATKYINTYSTIISRLRNAGLNFPLMIDAPDCGTDISIFSSVAETLQNADPKHNLIFSAHAYWFAYAQNDSLRMAALLAVASDLTVPVVLGEIANYQDDVNPCQYSLNYRALLHLCETFQMPWICWSWDRDNCNARQVSTNGQFNSLSAYGNDIVSHPDYGLKYTAKRTYYMQYKQSCLTTNLPASLHPLRFIVSSGADGVLSIRSTDSELQVVMITDMVGRAISRLHIFPNESATVTLPKGIYLLASEKNDRAIKVVL